MSNDLKKNPQETRGLKDGQRKNLPRYNRSPLGWLVIGLVVMTAMLVVNRYHRAEEIPFSPDFTEAVANRHVEEVVFHRSRGVIIGKYSAEGMAARPAGASQTFQVSYDPELLPDNFLVTLKENNVGYDFAKPEFWSPILWQLLPIVLFAAFIYFIFIRNMRMGGGGMLMSFGRSRHKVQNREHRVTFADVAGIDEAKEEVAETVEFLKNPKKFKKIGGRIPRGVLLVGPPGCGKTLLAKAIAGESDVPFFSISGSDFVEMFVGVGASRVRDLFKQAKENSPCIIFLDEIDAIGRKRGPGFVSGGHDEREQTLNAILVEMDGFDTNDQVIVIAATNRKDILDHALTRPGRFDRQVVVPLPDLKGRVEILKIHARSIRVGPDVDFERLARGTPMFSGAELEALINEAAISASMANKDYVEMSDMEEARDKVRWGRAKKSRVIDEYDKRLTAFHEAGHAFVQSKLKDADPLHKVSIIPRGPMGGATFALPEKDRFFYTKRYCVAQLQVCFGGRVAEAVFCDDISSGAQSDIKQATAIAREMVLTWGMGDELGPIDYGGDGLSDMYYPGPTREYSEKTAELIDREIKKLIDDAYTKARSLIEGSRDRVEALAKALLKYETLDASEVEMILSGRELEKPTVSDLLALEQKKTEEQTAEAENATA
ncbi:MAG: ATP-dependent zinc metalloprotease FtsH [Anaerohalosphaeraceae bacterium]|jgi:cell division protease FtsH